MKTVAYSSRTTQLRGIAILAVILIHILASIPGYIFTRPGENIIWIAIDQVARFSVPLFVALCGYGLYAKYAEQFSIRLFLTRRVWKLIPLYALWTLGLWLIFKMIPVWNTGSATYPLWRVFLFGSDYHLYFIPLIFQLYLIFPVLRHFFKKNARYTVIGTMALQWISYLFFNWYRSVDPSAALSTNQSQYILCISWIGYFSIGMLLAKQRILLSWKQNLLLILTWITSLIAVISMAVHDIKLGLDPLYALTFTRPEVIIYAILSSILALTIQLPQ